MSAYTTQEIRNVALVGHGGVGKTTLAEALLHAAGVTTRRGSVDDGTTTLDRDPDEVQRGSSISLAVASFDWTTPDGRQFRINLLDTPGHPDFEAEVDAALSVADLAVLVVSAADGVEVGTTLAWRKCVDRGIPRMVFVTREDKFRADFEGVVAALTERFGSGFAPLELPLGEESDFHGVVDVLTEEAHEYEGGHHIEPLPEAIADHEHELHDRVVEEIVSGDDDQLERYLEGEPITTAELERTLAAEVLAGIEFPVLVGSGATGVGVDRLADYICEIGPSPADRPTTVVAGDTEVDLAPDASQPPLLYVFKTISDQYVGRVTVFKVITGTVRTDDTLVHVGNGAEERLHNLVGLCGAGQTPVTGLVAGDIGAVTKLGSAVTGSTLAPRGQQVNVPAPTLPTAHLALVLVPKTQTDDDRLGEALQRLVQEDPSLVIDYDNLARRTVLRGVGDSQLAVALNRLEQRYGVSVDTDEVRVAYRRTVTTTAEAQGRLKKQSGGHGQFAVVDLRVTPLPRGAGFEFVDAVVGGAVPKQYVAAVQTGVEDTMATGGPSGIPIVDVRVECIDGKTHSVDSSDMAFKTAAAQGFLDAVEAASPVLLEPIARLQLRVPVEQQGDVLGDLSSRRGRVVASEQRDGDQWITAEVPHAEITRYAMDLRSMTAGRGTYWITDTFDDTLPPQLTGKVLAEYQH
jgi:elongation factor G